jgi:hypothetical protein
MAWFMERVGAVKRLRSSVRTVSAPTIIASVVSVSLHVGWLVSELLCRSCEYINRFEIAVHRNFVTASGRKVFCT